MTLPPGATDVRRIGGGDINEAFRVRLADGVDAFVKTRADAPAGEYACEAAALAWLGEPGALRTPRVLALDERYLALEWVEPGQLDAAGEEQLGRGLAAVHRAGAPRFGRFDRLADGADGMGRVGRLGGLRVCNEPAEDWPTFYAERRLRPLARRARERGALSAEGASAVEQVCERMPDLAGPREPPARLHGDLWQGNVLADTSGRPWLIDPASYGGHREVDLAMLQLFGSLSERVLRSYQELTPLSDGCQERVGLYQLLPLLVHALLFGGSYSEAAARMAMRYVS